MSENTQVETQSFNFTRISLNSWFQVGATISSLAQLIFIECLLNVRCYTTCCERWEVKQQKLLTLEELKL